MNKNKRNFEEVDWDVLDMPFQVSCVILERSKPIPPEDMNE